MTAAVLIRLDAPMQSWGNAPRGAHRNTHTRPTKTGLIGLIANALGRDYTDPVDDLAALRFAVRADRPGRVETDYHTVGSGPYPLLPGNIYRNPKWRRAAKKHDPTGPWFADYAAPAKISVDNNGETVGVVGNTVITEDRYLADAGFVAALTGDEHTITAVADALAAPARALWLGRKAYPPAGPLLARHTVDPLRDDNTVDVDEEDPFAALRTFPRLPRANTGPLDAWAETHPATTGATVVHDQPVTYADPRQRSARTETHTLITPPDPAAELNAYDFFEEPR